MVTDIKPINEEKIFFVIPQSLIIDSKLPPERIAVYCWLQPGNIQMARMPVIILPDMKVCIASLFLALAGVLLLKKKC